MRSRSNSETFSLGVLTLVLIVFIFCVQVAVVHNTITYIISKAWQRIVGSWSTECNVKQE